jgi:hypothetical protein
VKSPNLCRFIILACIAASLNGAANAGPLEAACYNDIQKYCAEMQQGERLKTCLLQNRENVALTCQQTMAATYDKVGTQQDITQNSKTSGDPR